MQYAVEQAVASLQAVLLASAAASGEAAHATERTAQVRMHCRAYNRLYLSVVCLIENAS